MTAQPDNSRPPLRAGAAQVDITPDGNIHLAGAVGQFRPAQYVQDRLYAKALVLESGGRKLCFVSLDLTIITEEWTAEIRRAAAAQCGFDPDAVMVHVTQTHSAPALGHFMVDRDLPTPSDLEWLRGGDPRYFPYAVERIVAAITQANAALQPVRLGFGSGIEGRIAHNRRAVNRNGRVWMPGPAWSRPLGPTNLRYLEGPIDPEVGVVCLQTAALDIVAFLLHYTCHPVNVFPRRIVSADWPGAWSDELQRRHGAACVPLVLNGCCGNINPWAPFDPDYVPDHQRMGRTLAEVTTNVMDTLTWADSAPLGWKVAHVRLPIRKVEPEVLEEARRVIAAGDRPRPPEQNPRQIDPAWVTAASVLSVELLRERQGELDYEVQVFRVGPVAFVGLPGEPFVEGQLRLKIESPAYPTYVAHCTSHYVGYLPTRDAYPRGGHEVDTRYWAKLTPPALDMVVDAAVATLRDIFSDPPAEEAQG